MKLTLVLLAEVAPGTGNVCTKFTVGTSSPLHKTSKSAIVISGFGRISIEIFLSVIHSLSVALSLTVAVPSNVVAVEFGTNAATVPSVILGNPPGMVTPPVKVTDGDSRLMAAPVELINFLSGTSSPEQ